MITSESKITVRYAETDNMGIAHHSNYPIWYEVARTDLIKKYGYTYSQMEEMGIMLPLLSLTSEYKKPAVYEDELIVKTYIKELTNTRITFAYEVYKSEDNSLINTGTTQHVWTNDKLRPVNLKKYNEEIFNVLSK